ADLLRDPRPTGPAALHQLAHARLAYAHPPRGLRARVAMQVAEGRRFALAQIAPAEHPLEQVGPARPRVQLGVDVALGGEVGVECGLAPARGAQLLDRP